MSVSGVGGSQANQYVTSDNLENNDATVGKGTEGAAAPAGAAATAGADATAGTAAACGAGAAKEAQGAHLLSLLSLDGDEGKVEPQIIKPSPNFEISIAVAGLSDMASLLKDLSALLSQMRRENSEASYQSAMANVSSLKADAAMIKENANKQFNMAIASAAINLVSDVAQGASQLYGAANSAENYALKGQAKAAKAAGNLDQARILKDQIQENKFGSDIFSGGAQLGQAGAKFVTGILDAKAKQYDSMTNAALKESEAYRAQNEAAAKVIDQLFNSIDDLIKKVADVMSDVAKTSAETRRSILG